MFHCHCLFQTIQQFISSSFLGEYSITAREWIIKTRNYETATFEWYFNFPENVALFIDIVTVSNLNADINKIAYKVQNAQFRVYDNMRDRVKISIPRNRHGVIIDISNIVISDGGNYRCKAQLSSGSVLSNISKLEVIGNLFFCLFNFVILLLMKLCLIDYLVYLIFFNQLFCLFNFIL